MSSRYGFDTREDEDREVQRRRDAQSKRDQAAKDLEDTLIGLGPTIEDVLTDWAAAKDLDDKRIESGEASINSIFPSEGGPGAAYHYRSLTRPFWRNAQVIIIAGTAELLVRSVDGESAVAVAFSSALSRAIEPQDRIHVVAMERRRAMGRVEQSRNGPYSAGGEGSWWQQRASYRNGKQRSDVHDLSHLKGYY